MRLGHRLTKTRFVTLQWALVALTICVSAEAKSGPCWSFDVPSIESPTQQNYWKGEGVSEDFILDQLAHGRFYFLFSVLMVRTNKPNADLVEKVVAASAPNATRLLNEFEAKCQEISQVYEPGMAYPSGMEPLRPKCDQESEDLLIQVWSALQIIYDYRDILDASSSSSTSRARAEILDVSRRVISHLLDPDIVPSQDAAARMLPEQAYPIAKLGLLITADKSDGADRQFWTDAYLRSYSGVVLGASPRRRGLTPQQSAELFFRCFIPPYDREALAAMPQEEREACLALYDLQLLARATSDLYQVYWVLSRRNGTVSFQLPTVPAYFDWIVLINYPKICNNRVMRALIKYVALAQYDAEPKPKRNLLDLIKIWNELGGPLAYETNPLDRAETIAAYRTLARKAIDSAGPPHALLVETIKQQLDALPPVAPNREER